MSQALLIILGIYLAGCYAYGIYLLIRLVMSKTIVHPTSRQEPTKLARAARVELEQEGIFQDEQRVAA